MDDVPEFDRRPSIMLDHLMPENPKIVGLSDAAFRLYIEVVCWCSRHESDGSIPTPMIQRMARSPKVITELIKANLIRDELGSYTVKDYLLHQRSRREIAALRQARRTSGSRGNHMRWHVARRRFDANCEHCQEGEDE